MADGQIYRLYEEIRKLEERIETLEKSPLEERIAKLERDVKFLMGQVTALRRQTMSSKRIRR